MRPLPSALDSTRRRWCKHNHRPRRLLLGAYIGQKGEHTNEKDQQAVDHPPGRPGPHRPAGGDKSDPLVTLSYLNDTAIPQVVKQVEASTATRQKELEESFSHQINQYILQIGQGGQGGGSSAGYTLVTMTSGQVMHLDVGCEVLLRVGTASVQSSENPALIDLTTGDSVSNGTSLTKNHLYMSTIEGRTLTATAGTVKVLVRGGYTVA